MKMKKLMIATAAVVLSSQAMGQAYTGSLSASVGGGSYDGAMPVGVVGNVALRNALQAAQLDAACVGNDSKTCMPSISTVELVTVMAAQFGNNWNDFNIGAFGPSTNPFASTVVCEVGPTGASSDAARVAIRYAGYGCTASNPETLLSPLSTALNGAVPGLSGDVVSCLGAAEGAGAGAIGFATADSQDAAYRFIKLDGQAPDLDNFAAGNYSMFGDIHGTQLAATVTQPWGVAGSLNQSANPPMHSDNGSFIASNECAAGIIRNRTGGDLTQ